MANQDISLNSNHLFYSNHLECLRRIVGNKHVDVKVTIVSDSDNNGVGVLSNKNVNPNPVYEALVGAIGPTGCYHSTIGTGKSKKAATNSAAKNFVETFYPCRMDLKKPLSRIKSMFYNVQQPSTTLPLPTSSPPRHSYDQFGESSSSEEEFEEDVDEEKLFHSKRFPTPSMPEFTWTKAKEFIRKRESAVRTGPHAKLGRFDRVINMNMSSSSQNVISISSQEEEEKEKGTSEDDHIDTTKTQRILTCSKTPRLKVAKKPLRFFLPDEEDLLSFYTT